MEKIYRHFYDNSKEKDGKEKPNELLGTFEIKEGSMDGHDFEFVGVRQEDGKKYRVHGQEISGLADSYNAGTKCFVEFITEETVEDHTRDELDLEKQGDLEELAKDNYLDR